MNGSAKLNKAHYRGLEINGSLLFDNLLVDNLLQVNGSVEGKNLKCKILEVNGAFEGEEIEAENIESNGSFIAKNIKITNNTEINGSINITSGSLNNIYISASEATFIESNIKGNIVVKAINKSNKNKKLQTLEFKKNSIVLGDITFEDEGQVCLFDNSEIKGKIVNARLIRKNN